MVLAPDHVPECSITSPDKRLKSLYSQMDGFKVQKSWQVTRYHISLDNTDQVLNCNSGAKAARVNFLVGFKVAQQDIEPTWNKDGIFGEKVGL